MGLGGRQLSILGKGMETEESLEKIVCGSVPGAKIYSCLNSGHCMCFRIVSGHEFTEEML